MRVYEAIFSIDIQSMRRPLRWRQIERQAMRTHTLNRTSARPEIYGYYNFRYLFGKRVVGVGIVVVGAGAAVLSSSSCCGVRLIGRPGTVGIHASHKCRNRSVSTCRNERRRHSATAQICITGVVLVHDHSLFSHKRNVPTTIVSNGLERRW